MQRARCGVSLALVMNRPTPRLALSLAFVLAACGQATPAGAPASSAEASSSAQRTPLGSVLPPRIASTPTASASAAPAPAPSAFGEAVRALSEPNGPFFSDNTISNETSYLQVATALAKHAKHDGAYIGVGPEQNFTYIALTRPKLAFIVDIRRQNMVLHLLYKAIFEEAT